MKIFNTTAVCTPEDNYMVDLSSKVKEIAGLVDSRKYFSINRARQYGKTTTLIALEKYLSDRYDVISLDFQDITDAVFKNESVFTKGLAQVLCDTRDSIGIPLEDEFYEAFSSIAKQDEEVVLNDLFRVFDRWCRENDKGIVLIIDEVDSATNNQVFLDFLGKLRSNYLKRQKRHSYRTFQSVILAGVTDVKHLKGKIREDTASKENSPWNIAADFDIDMSLSEEGINGMLKEYEADHQTGMNTGEIAKLLRDYTNGYPFLVSRLCQLMDEKLVPEKFLSLSEVWTRRGVDEAVKLLLSENNTLFQTITKNLNNSPELKAGIKSILMEGTKLPFNAQQDEIVRMEMYGLIRKDDNSNTICIANRIFETMLYNLFLSDEELKSNAFSREGDLERNIFVQDGKLNVRLIFERINPVILIARKNRIGVKNTLK